MIFVLAPEPSPPLLRPSSPSIYLSRHSPLTSHPREPWTFSSRSSLYQFEPKYWRLSSPLISGPIGCCAGSYRRSTCRRRFGVRPTCSGLPSASGGKRESSNQHFGLVTALTTESQILKSLTLPPSSFPTPSDPSLVGEGSLSDMSQLLHVFYL